MKPTRKFGSWKNCLRFYKSTKQLYLMLTETFRCLMTKKIRRPTSQSCSSWTASPTCERTTTRWARRTVIIPSYLNFSTQKLMTKLKVKKAKHKFKKKSQYKKSKGRQNGRVLLVHFWTQCPFQFVTFAPRDIDRVCRSLPHNGLLLKLFLSMRLGRWKNLKTKVFKRFLCTWLA